MKDLKNVSPDDASAKEEEYFKNLKGGLLSRISDNPVVISITGFTKLFSLVTMLLGLYAIVDITNPFTHNPLVIQGYSTPFISPAKTTLFNHLESASKNEKMKNTKYMFAYNNGKSTARVCTDLKQKEFESLTGMTDAIADDESVVSRYIDVVNGDVLDMYTDRCRSDTYWNGTAPPLARYAGCLDWDDISDLKGFNFFTALEGNIKRPAMGSCMPTETDKKVLVAPRDTYDWISKKSYPAHNRDDISWQTQGGWMWHYMARGTLFPGPNTTAIPTERRPYQGHGEEIEKEEEWGDIEPFWALCDKNTLDQKQALFCKVCGYTLGKFNDKDRCEQKYVYSYYGGSLGIMILFIVGTMTRIVILVLNISWGLLEEQLNYRIMFSRYSPLIAYSLCKHGRKTVVFSLHTEHLQGWPWVLGLLDKLLVTSLLLGSAWGVDPFPELARGRATMLLLWISAIGELYALVHLLHITFTRKSWIVIGHRGARCCHCEDVIPWPCTMTQEAYDAAIKGKEDPNKAREYNVDVEMK